MGNDVVDLTDPENLGKSRDKRFLDRVFTGDERRRIGVSSSPDRLLWSFWAAKEAAYKAVSRLDPGICSTPRQYPVRVDGDVPEGAGGRLAGEVCTPDGTLALDVFLTADWVHAVAAGTEDQLRRLRHRVDRIEAAEPADPSAFVRTALLGEIARHVGCSIEELAVVNDRVGPGVPRILLLGLPFAAEVSLSHDGRFAAFVFDPLSLSSAVSTRE